MSYNNSITIKILYPASFLAKIILLIIAWSLTAYGVRPDKQSSTTASQQNTPSDRIILPETVGTTWRTVGNGQTFKVAEYKSPSTSNIGIEYGLETVSKRIYSNGKEKLTVEAFEMRFPSGAYGFFTYFRSLGNVKSYQFCVGRYLVKVQGETSEKAIITHFVSDLSQASMSEKGNSTPLIDHLPKLNIVPLSEIYFIGPKALSQNKNFGFLVDAVTFDGGTEAASAIYQFGTEPVGILILEYHTPQLATDGYVKIDLFLKTLPDNEKSQTTLDRVGNYVVIATGTKDKKIAEHLIGQIKYTAKVYWEGDKFTSIPLEFRPPDPAAIEESIQTANVLLRTFYWIGLMLLLAAILGILAGSSFFYWRKYQRKKNGEEDLFSNAGGTIRLNLETEELEIANSEKKLLK